jgi:hypothetical protein
VWVSASGKAGTFERLEPTPNLSGTGESEATESEEHSTLALYPNTIPKMDNCSLAEEEEGWEDRREEGSSSSSRTCE